jgi:mono/diheme cytochrome c family protein
MTDCHARFSLRQLPLPAKLVLSCFLVAVGLGYFSALVQLHLQHSSRNGDHLPGVGDVVEVFAGKKKADPSHAGDKPVCKLEALVMGPVEGAPWNGSGSMAAAFFHKSEDGSAFAKLERENPAIRDQREGERKAIQAWLNAPEADRQKAYDADSFPLPPDRVGQPITPDYLANNGGAAKVKSILTDRCARCHRKGEAQANYPLETYTQVTKYLTVPPAETAVDGWVRSERQMSIEALTQSTHAHLLSFAVLFTLTGLTFAFTNYWYSVRMLFAPLVLVAQVADVSCWWLARIDGPGVYFAMTIIATGGLVGAGLIVQIVGSLFDMYGPKGKVLVLLLLLLGAAALGAVYTEAIAPALSAQKQALAAKAVVVAEVKADRAAESPTAVVAPQPKPAGDPAAPPVTHLERLVMGPIKGADWNGKGSMAAAFFHKDGAGFAKKAAENPRLQDEREGERKALQAWIRSDDASRKAAYAADLFPLPKELAGKPITDDYVSADKAKAKIKSLVADRCARCHTAGAEAEQFPLETYEQIAKYLKPETK